MLRHTLLTALLLTLAGGCGAGATTEPDASPGSPGSPAADAAQADPDASGPADAAPSDAWVQPACDEAALEELATEPGALPTTWLGIRSDENAPCPVAGMGWTTEPFLDGFCIYRWAGDGELALCELPFDGQRAPWHWLEPDQSF